MTTSVTIPATVIDLKAVPQFSKVVMVGKVCKNRRESGGIEFTCLTDACLQYIYILIQSFNHCELIGLLAIDESS